MSNVRGDRDDFYNFYSPRLCRGDKLADVLKDIQEGVKAKKNMVGGFSSSKEVCRKFAGSRFLDNRPAVERLPAVVIISRQDFHEANPEAIEVVYEPEWLEKHPEVVEAIQTYQCTNRSLADKVSSAECYSHEQETLVNAERAAIPQDGKVNIYVGPEDLEQAGLVREEMWSRDLKDYTEKMDEMVELIRARLPEKFQFNVQVFFCHETLNLGNECESACKLWDTIYPKRDYE